MRRLSSAFLISLGAHILIFLLVFRTQTPESGPSAGPFLMLYAELEVVPAGSRSVPSGRQGRSDAGPASPDAAGDVSGGLPERESGGAERLNATSGTAGPADGSGLPGRETARSGSRYLPVAGPVSRRTYAGSAAADSAAAAHVRDWRKSEWDFSGVRPPADAAGEMMRKRSGLADVFRPDAPQPKPEKNPVRFDFMPSEIQVRAMASVYRKEKPTQKDLYLDLDPGRPMTASIFNRELEFLVSKGFLTRKKISPQNPLMLVTPVGAVPVEMSRLNRLNPVYEYKPQVDRSRLLAFLQSHQTRLRDRLVRAAAQDSAAAARALAECERSMAALAEEK
ncbi:hypothetical protein JW777_04455 [bacterium]|nr:hypothetical protein [bacterium]